MNLDDGELDPRLAHVAAGLSSLAVDPSTASRQRLRAAVHDANITPELTHSRMPRAWGHRPLRLGGIALAMCVATVGTGAGAMAASSEALPGSPNHGLRLVGEDLSLALAPSSEKARLHGRFVRDRLSQAAEARRRGEKKVASELLSESRRYLQDFNQEIRQLPASQRPAAEGELHQLETDAQEPGQQGPASNSSPATPNQESRPPGGDAGGADQPGVPARQSAGSDGVPASPAGEGGGVPEPSPGAHQDGPPQG